MIGVYILIAIVVIILILTWVVYNRMVNAHNIVKEAYSGIDVQLKKRFELIPSLVQVVKGYNKHEAETLNSIVKKRNISGETVNEMASNDATVTNQLRNFKIHIEDYPDLKSNTQFLKLMDNLSTIENELAMSRRYFNGATRDFNTKMGVFPAVLFVKMLGFKEVEFYQIEENEKIIQPVDLNN
ncbi:MAG: LemA family protein [Brumimicrobium sp.]